MKSDTSLTRNLDGYFFRENFLVASVVTIFVIRFFLKVTDYPQLQGAGLHIAHLLWGGFFMLVAILLLYSFMGRGVTILSSVLGGIGFGAFIDELGKFITSDNNYFFQPTIALLYLIFILLYILSKFITNRGKITQKEYFANALEMVREAVLNDLDTEEKKRALLYLQKCDQSDPLVISLTKFVNDIESIRVAKPSRFVTVRHAVSKLYLKGANLVLVKRAVVTTILVQAAINIYSGVSIFIIRPNITFVELGVVISSSFAALLVLIGLVQFRSSRIRGFRFFKMAILVSLLITQFFTFYQEQFRALVGLGINIVLLTVIDYTINKESSK